MAPPYRVPSQAAPLHDPIPLAIEPQMQALVLLQTQALPQNVASLAPKPSPTGSSPESGIPSKSTGGAATKALATRQFQLVRQLYAEDDEPPPLISIVG